MHQTRHLPLEGLHNIRDLGGYPRRSGGETAWGRYYRSCGMSGLSEAGERELSALGIETILDLRSQVECERAPGPFAAHPGRHRIGLFDGLDPVAMLFSSDAEASFADRYITALETRGPAFATVIETIADAADGPILFHCSVGKDRTGLVAAILLLLAGVEEEVVVADYALTGTLAAGMLEEMRLSAVANGADPEMMARIMSVRPDYLHRALADVRMRHGGIEAYLLDAGCSRSAITRAVARFDA